MQLLWASSAVRGRLSAGWDAAVDSIPLLLVNETCDVGGFSPEVKPGILLAITSYLPRNNCQQNMTMN